MKQVLSQKKQFAAYVLNKAPDYGFSQKKIAQMMDVGQSTISNAIARVEHMRQIQDLTRQLEEARNLLVESGIMPQPESPIFYLDS